MLRGLNRYDIFIIVVIATMVMGTLNIWIFFSACYSCYIINTCYCQEDDRMAERKENGLCHFIYFYSVTLGLCVADVDY